MATDFRNSGSGSQYNSTSGNQNNNSGSGNQFNANTINYNAQNRSDSKLLADLRVTDPRNDKARIERRKGGLLPDSYRWILDHEAFIRWQTDTQSSLLWIRGDPGKGKTMLICGIIDELPELMREWETIYFFCEATDSRLNNATAVLRSLLYLLLIQRPSLSRFILEEHEHAGKQLFEDANAWDVLDKTFTNIVQDGGLNDFILIIDALDECEAGLDQLLVFIVRLSLSNVKVIASSRNWLSIEERVVVADQVCISLELNEMLVSAAVSRYISYKVDQLATRKKYDIDTRKYVHDRLSSKAKDTFLWVALVTDQLGKPDVFERHARTKVDEFPQGLDDLYQRMLDRTWNSNDKDMCRRILAVVSIIYRPVTLLELMSLADLGEFCNKIPILKEIIGECGFLLTVKDNIVYFVHQSAKDFLFRHALAETMPAGIHYEHSLLLPRSLRIMSNTCRRNIYNLKEPGASLEDICIPVPDPLGPARYACVYWLEHLKDGGYMDEQQYSQVYDFLKQHFLHWIEALSLLKSMSVGIASLFKLTRAIQAFEVLEKKLFVQDALRFIRYFRVAVENWPLQVYSSALVFSPTHSIIRKQFQREVAGWIIRKPMVDDEWSSCLQTLEDYNGSCASLALSPDGVTLASTSAKKTVNIWDVITGECIRTLQVQSVWVNEVVFSHGGHMLASASKYGVLEVWDRATGRLLNTFHATPADCLSERISFCSGDQQIAFASGGTVEIWDIITGRSVRQVHGFESASYGQVAFSADGSLFALVTRELRVDLFETNTWACSQTFYALIRPKDGQGAYRKVALSGDGTRLVSYCGEDKLLGVWDTRTGTKLTWMSHNVEAKKIACSQDGGLIASVAVRFVEIRDGNTGQVFQRLPFPSGDIITAMIFSPNGTQLVSASLIGKIKVWDVTRHQKRQFKQAKTLLWDTLSTPMPPENQIMDEVTDTRLISRGAATVEYAATEQDSEAADDYHVSILSMAFSHDKSQVASVSTQRISLWDFDTGQCLKTAWTNIFRKLRTLALVYSENGILLAIVDQGSLSIWDVALDLQLKSRWCLGTNYKHVVSKVAFSNDGTIVAGVIDQTTIDQTVKLWDSTTGDCKATFIVPDYVRSLKFSESGSYLITNIGNIDLESLTSTGEEMSTPRTAKMTRSTTLGFTLSKDDGGSWILKDSKPILWVPPEYRGWTLTARGSAIALGMRSGRVLMMKFSPDLSVM